MRDHPSPDQVLAHLERVLVSAKFRNADSATTLLRFVVKAKLEGDPISERSIALGAFKLNDFNPLINSSVRGAAKQVRAKLPQYYLRLSPGLTQTVKTLPAVR